MPRPRIEFLSQQDLQAIHETSLAILRDTGINVHNAGVRARLLDAGARALPAPSSIRLVFNEAMVYTAIKQAGKQFILHGRDPQRIARFGFGDQNMISSPGQYAWFDHNSGARRSPWLADARLAGRLGDALENLTIVGGMAVPVDVPAQIRDIVLTVELLKQTTKPVRAFPVSARSASYVLEILKAVSGGADALRSRPMTEMLIEPISPLQLPDRELDIMQEFLACGQPVSIGPMAMASGTAPATLAGVLAQENAEILAALVAVQAVAPGTPVLYGGIPHIMDQRTSICSFGSPEQGLLALGMTALGKYYGFPVYVNVNLTDSKLLDAQAGLEKMGSLILGMLAGADLFGHAGIVGTDHGGCLSWLLWDHEAVHYARRVARGFTLEPESLALATISAVGPGGNFLDQDHTVRHFRRELWFPGSSWTRQTYDGWFESGGTSMQERLVARVDQLLASHQPSPIDPHLERELDRIVAAAHRELVEA